MVAAGCACVCLCVCVCTVAQLCRFHDVVLFAALLQTLMDRLRQKALQEELRASLRALPEPLYTYDVVLPEVSLHPPPPTFMMHAWL